MTLMRDKMQFTQPYVTNVRGLVPCMTSSAEVSRGS
jgi:hypothetical protein